MKYSVNLSVRVENATENLRWERVLKLGDGDC